jgi:hypothetical protein
MANFRDRLESLGAPLPHLGTQLCKQCGAQLYSIGAVNGPFIEGAKVLQPVQVGEKGI